MNEEKLARSANPKWGIPPQSYRDHILAVVENALYFAKQMLRYQKKKPKVFEAIIEAASALHDLGKLDVLGQQILSGQRSGKMLNHVDAGVAVLVYMYRKSNNFAYLLAAIIIHGHHIGFMNDQVRGSPGFTRSSLLNDPSLLRDHQTMEKYLGCRSAQKRVEVAHYVDRHLEALIKEHIDITGLPIKKLPSLKTATALEVRFLSSCLVAADHADATRHTGFPAITKDSEVYPLRARERRQQLERLVRERFGKIGDHKDNPRQASRLRQFRAAKTIEIEETHPGFLAVKGPVGSAKTTAYAEIGLRLAENDDLRRMFILAPYNTIIDQTVETFRDLLVLPDEYYPDRIVAAHHCNNDYGGQLTKAYNVTHMSPVVASSGVQFFETLASDNPARSKKAHNLPGSVIIFDEFPKLLPITLWPVASLWLRELVDNWGCKVIYSSGTPVEFWDIPLLQSEQLGCISKIAPQKVVTYPTAEKQLRKVEKDRIKYENLGVRTFFEIVNDIFEKPGPRVVVCNTVQNAALIAHYVSLQHGRESVEHLSTALCPRDRMGYVDADRQRHLGVIGRVKKRLEDKEDTNWVLVATSCVESGLDFSFRTGFSEERSLESLSQTSGRVSRKMEYDCSVVYNFILRGDLKTENPSFVVSSRVLHEIFENGEEISPELCTAAYWRELEQTFGGKSFEKAVDLVRAERTLSMKQVSADFRVINTPATPVLISSGIFERFIVGEMEGSPWTLQEQMQQESVQIFSSKLEKGQYPIVPLSDFVEHDLFETNREWERFPPEDIYIWAGGYDKDFLGYMNEVLLQLGVEGVERAPIPWNDDLQHKYG